MWNNRNNRFSYDTRYIFGYCYFSQEYARKTGHSISWSCSNWKKSSDCFMAFSDWELLPQCFKNICCRKIGKQHKKLLSSYQSSLSKDFVKFPRTLSGTAKAIATFKETGMKFHMHIWLPEHNSDIIDSYFPFFSKIFQILVTISSTFSDCAT